MRFFHQNPRTPMGFAHRIHFPLALDMLLLDSLLVLGITQGNNRKFHGKRVRHTSFADFIDLLCTLSTRALGVRHTSFTAFADLLYTFSTRVLSIEISNNSHI